MTTTSTCARGQILVAAGVFGIPLHELRRGRRKLIVDGAGKASPLALAVSPMPIVRVGAINRIANHDDQLGSGTGPGNPLPGDWVEEVGGGRLADCGGARRRGEA